MIRRIGFGGFLAVVLALVSTASYGELTLESCPDAVNHFGLVQVDVDHEVQAGESLRILLSHIPKRTLTNGKLEVSLLIEGLSVVSTSYDLCDVSKCTLNAHEASSFAVNFLVPDEVPSDFSTSLQIVASDYDGNRITCMHAEGIKVTGGSKFVKDSESEFGPFKIFQLINTRSWFDGPIHEGKPSTRISDVQLEFLFNAWVRQHGGNYGGKYKKRLRIFKRNLLAIADHNRQGTSSYTLGLNRLAIYNQKEFAKKFFGLKLENATKDKKFFEQDVLTGVGSLPTSFDWTAKGAVTEVKNQGQCGSCWAFSAIGALEGAYYLKTGKLISFSEQRLVSCDHTDSGCMGGEMHNAFNYVRNSGGVCKEEDYPYTGFAMSCRKCEIVPGTTPQYVADVSRTDASLEHAILKQPVSVGVEADQFAFQFYRSGVLTGRCGTNLDHGVLAVGYGTLKGIKYFKIKNSWGPSYGMNGYVLIERGSPQGGGECGVLLEASYPIL